MWYPNRYLLNGWNVEVKVSLQPGNRQPGLHLTIGDKEIEPTDTQAVDLPMGKVLTGTIHESESYTETISIILPNVSLSDPEERLTTWAIWARELKVTAPSVVKGPLTTYNAEHLVGTARIVKAGTSPEFSSSSAD